MRKDTEVERETKESGRSGCAVFLTCPGCNDQTPEQQVRRHLASLLPTCFRAAKRTKQEKAMKLKTAEGRSGSIVLLKSVVDTGKQLG